jgi:hypothetical protein
MCGSDAEYIRYTQFSGNHPYCDKHAKLERDFGQCDYQYFMWMKIKR